MVIICARAMDVISIKMFGYNNRFYGFLSGLGSTVWAMIGHVVGGKWIQQIAVVDWQPLCVVMTYVVHGLTFPFFFKEYGRR